MKYFILVNVILLSALTVFYWLPEGRELIAAYEALRLQEQRMASIEADHQMSNTYQAEIDAFKSENTEHHFKLIPYSEIINHLKDLQDLSQRLGLAETALLLEEPVHYDTSAGTVAVVHGAVSYSGDYTILYEMADSWLNSSCQTETIAIHKDSGRLDISFYICGIYE
jgi:hypothetical protein